MTLSRRTFLSRTAALTALSGAELSADASAEAVPAPTPNPGTVNLATTTLHGYGTLSATFHSLDSGRSSLLRILCETPQKALLTQAKYLSDLVRLPGLTKAVFHSQGRSLSCYRSAMGGVVACYAQGREVLILAAADEAALVRLCGTTVPASATATEFGARASIPMYLDRWDRHGLIIYFAVLAQTW